MLTGSSPFVQIVAFRPHVNEPSSIISDADFKFMGDVSEASVPIM